MVAVRLGFRDAVCDWAILYSVLYGVVFGLTREHMDPKALAMYNGFGWFLSAALLAILSGKIPQWIGFYHKRRLQFIRDKSDRAIEVNVDGTTLRMVRLQVRLGVGQQFNAFVFLVLPFYAALRVWAYLTSALVGIIAGYAFMFSVYSAKNHYATTRRRRAHVSAASASALLLLSSVMILLGVRYVHDIWNTFDTKSTHTTPMLYAITVVAWLAALLLYHASEYATQRKIEKEADLTWSRLFDEADDAIIVEKNVNNDKNKNKANNDNDDALHDNKDDLDGNTNATQIQAAGADGGNTHNHNNNDNNNNNNDNNDNDNNNNPDSGQDQSGTPRRVPRRGITRIDGQKDGIGRRASMWYQAGFFDPKTLFGVLTEEEPTAAAAADVSPPTEKEDTQDNTTTDHPNELALPPQRSAYEIYKEELNNQDDAKRPSWWNWTWEHLPLFSLWHIYLDKMNCSNCSRSFRRSSTDQKVALTIGIVAKFFVNASGMYLALVACAATQQIKTTKEGLPAVRRAIYDFMDDGPVCAFEKKGGDVRTFESKEVADASNYTIAHCGACGHCSNWIDLELEYSTRSYLAAAAQKCGVKTLGKSIDALQECLMGPTIGWTEQCALCWAEDMVCTKKHCMFIFLQSHLTNQVGNFAVGPNDITAATCEEAMCEKDPGQFVPCSGATRRRMNVTSSIQRPGAQRCAIVGVPDWGEFFSTE